MRKIPTKNITFFLALKMVFLGILERAAGEKIWYFGGIFRKILGGGALYTELGEKTTK